VHRLARPLAVVMAAAVFGALALIVVAAALYSSRGGD
jgi:hypothetical protein